MNRLEMPRKRIKREDRQYKFFQYFHEGRVIGEIKLAKSSRYRRYQPGYLKDLEVMLFQKKIVTMEEA